VVKQRAVVPRLRHAAGAPRVVAAVIAALLTLPGCTGGSALPPTPPLRTGSATPERSAASQGRSTPASSASPQSSAVSDGPPTSVSEAIALERADALPITAFYDNPGDLGETRPGDLLRQEPGTGYDLPTGAAAVRILYHSRDSSGGDVATSGVVLVPAGTAPSGGWPIIAWAHGTSGVARSCAPSAMKDLYYGEEGLLPMVRSGYAVVATDYHGLGTAGGHEYSNRAAQANDVVYSVPAAREAVPALGRRWVVDGHSQGGAAAWLVDQTAGVRDDRNFLGAVSVAGAVQGARFARSLDRHSGQGFFLAFMAAGIQAVNRRFDPALMLTSAVMRNYPAVTTRGCLFRAYATYAHLPAGTGLRPGWDRLPAVRQFFADLTPSAAPLAAPMLAIAGGADRTVPVAGVRRAVAGLCAAGQPVRLRTYAGLDHDPTMTRSTPFQLHWIARRFAGKSASTSCRE
jgi:hypothetical protein